MKIDKTRRFFRTLSGEIAEAKAEANEARLRSNTTLARLALAALFAFTLTAGSIAFTTTHLDLLLNTKVKLFGIGAELPRDWSLALAAIVLVVLQYEALSLNLRLQRQYESWLVQLPRSSFAAERKTRWLHGGLLSDLASQTKQDVLLRLLARVVFVGGLCLAPLLTLVFIQAVVMPAHSEALTTTIRLCVLASAALCLHAAIQRLGMLDRTKAAQEERFRHKIGRALISPIGCCALVVVFLSLHVFIWPGEFVQRATTRVLLTLGCTSCVWGSEEDGDNPTRSFLWWRENPYTHNVFAFTHLSLILPYHFPERDAQTAISTQFYRQALSRLSDRFSPNLILRDVDLSPIPLTAEQKYVLDTLHRPQAITHPDFANTLNRLPIIDLSDADLRFATFDKVWAPNLRLIGHRHAHGLRIYRSHLPGAEIEEANEDLCERCPPLLDQLSYSDVSRGWLRRLLFRRGLRNLNASYSTLNRVKVNGLVYGSHFGSANLYHWVCLPELPKRYTAEIEDSESSILTKPNDIRIKQTKGCQIHRSNFYRALIFAPQLHNAEITESKFEHAIIEAGMFYGETVIRDSDFPVSLLAGRDRHQTKQ